MRADFKSAILKTPEMNSNPRKIRHFVYEILTTDL